MVNCKEPLLRTTTFVLLNMCVAALALGGCSSTVGTLPDATPVAHSDLSQAYNPLAPAIETTPAKQALQAATGLLLGGYTVVALDRHNQPDLLVLEALEISASVDSLVIGLKHSVPFVGLYISYDSKSTHATGFNTTRPDGIALAVEPEAGLIAVGVCALAGNQLDPSYPVVSISFSEGASSAPKLLAAISTNASNAVTDLEAVDSGEESATLGWSERNTGDYDLNGEVNVSDITPIAVNYGKSYTPESADFAKLEVVDGDGNGEVNISDITPIVLNFLSTVKGYNVYRMPLASIDDNPVPGDPGWELIPNISDSSKPTIERDFNGQNFRLRYSYLDTNGNGDFAWYVAAVGPGDNPTDEGTASNVSKVSVTGGTPPDAGLSFVIMPPDGTLMNLDDEFYVGIQIADVTGLFSANVRFEYDGSLLEFMEAVSAYDTNLNLLEPPLFLAADDVDEADSPYILLGFNATQIQGTITKSGTGFLGYFKFKVIDASTNLEAIRFPVASNFIWLWGEQYGVPIATPVLGSPQVINAG